MTGSADQSVISQPLDAGDVHRLADGTLLDEQAQGDARSEAAQDRRRAIVSGLTWGVLFQALEVAVSFAAMLVLVRILPPVDYGRAAATAGIVALLGILNAHLFIGHALQLPDGETPDWSQHWAFAFYIQAALSLACHAVAAVCWFVPAYLPIAKLLHLAAFGVLFDAANHVGATMLRRDLRLRRIKIVSSIGIFVRIIAIVVLALLGGRAYAIVMGNNVLSALPFGVDLFIVRGWRPDPGWWKLPRWRTYQDALRFGSQRAAAGVISGLRDAAETLVLPVTLGFAGIGLMNRAQALYAATLGRMTTVLADTVYPFLPRESRNPERYAQYATLYLQVTLLIAIPGALFVGGQGRLVSRVLYGTKWIAADPLLWPGALIGFAGAVCMVATSVLLAAGRLRACLLLDAATFVSIGPSLWFAWSGAGLLPYAWALASTQLVLAAVSLGWAGPLLAPEWFARTVLPPAVAAAIALVASTAVAWLVAGHRPQIELAAIAAAFVAVLACVLRISFAETLKTLLGHLPAGDRAQRLLGFSMTPATALATAGK
jgi:O-antigen/teichoic acid export membrane protein